jgi:DNA-directed RNA polymerase subunit M/transcription elongation factor TFIIS
MRELVRMSEYIVKCPKCKKEELSFNFAGCNGYVAFCKECKGMMYLCSIMSTVDFFEMTGERFDMMFSELKEKKEV